MTTQPPDASPPMMGDTAPSVPARVGATIARLQRESARTDRPTSWAAATLAALRNATPGRVDETPASWDVVYSTLPEEALGRGDDISWDERATHAALVLYAVHQTSQSAPMHQPEVRLGQALRRLPDATDEKSPILRRFTSLVSASTFDATLYHLRSLIALLRRDGITLDYVRLCQDLVRLQSPRTAPVVRRQWGRDFFGGRGVDAPAPDGASVESSS
ncbi:CRISPR system Cascade subunit CasB [Kineosphaera limosa]|uniref:Putative CRISPR-associated protein n=1 Tax=Kineosphaera limosa NBRC 100340 TaxID=1184609 RepID=K6VGE2_9MICO|nr:type I-E CRISPR-associated protein Cse2/CasB [Kineosphaera limosa]NYE01504.1 CRISPR system Cascade subunit CasB [Kineosphaera limosa]GAB95248.1 putative CRISPR-associated protein [Kineosphaera limosa NBRC 100340]